MFLRTLGKRLRLLAAPLGLLALALPAGAHNLVFTIPLSDTQEVPPSGTGGSGTATLTLDTHTGAVTVTGSYTGLSSNQTLAHIHGPAAAGTNNVIVVTLTGTGGTSGTISGAATISAAQVDEMEAGLYYVNVHTMNFGAGEIRGQICENGASVNRNPGSNPLSYTCSPLIFGGTLSATVDLSLTGHGFAILIGFDSKINLVLGGGQQLLCIDLSGAGELFTGAGLGPVAGPLATFSVPLPSALSMCNFDMYTQAIQFGTVIPFALSNAQDLTLGF